MAWVVDQAHTEIGFSVRHLMVAKVHGVFKEFEARIELDEAAPERSRVEATISAASISTKAEDRDAHLRSPDFFGVEQYPVIRFVSKRVDRLRNGSFEVVGDLNIRDVTQEV